METTTQDNRKRAMDAIDRRCALEKAEQLKQQRKKEVGPKRESGREVSKPSEHLTVARGTKSSLVSASKDAQADDLAYVMLSHPVHKNLLEAPTEVSKEKGTRVDRFMHELLQKGDSAKKYMQSFRSKKFNDVILLDNYVKRRSGFVGSRLRALQTHSKRSKVHMSMKEHKKCGTFDLSQDLCQFHHFVPMHEMWKSYMIELFKSRKGDPLDKSLLTADLHGAIIHVADCKVTSFIGANGIMIRETAATFGLITRDNKFRVVPKRDSVFIFQADCWKVTLFGEKLIGRDSGL
ncbi:ribonuclease P protein subunit p29 isoform X2 [Punica granatum]|uniref:Ribonuclease P protein subunit p29 isoform X2 n=1 Tax=Punica granatum TaxID=22663 RepID=A0A6P8EAR8_PUNGR|nr:ribonuclease P protein subunit p29 isoform X2 [Punica granatum]XP_031407092.1 ribonuclease P protein subunit p29 isoform X2 [Punica granatum]